MAVEGAMAERTVAESTMVEERMERSMAERTMARLMAERTEKPMAERMVVVERPTAERRIPAEGVRNTLRFQCKDGMTMMTWEEFATQILSGRLKLTVREVICLQRNTQDRGFDVTLADLACCERVKQEWERRKVEGAPFTLFDVIGLERPNYRVITVHLYNPHVTDQAVAQFLERYVQLLGAPRRLNGVCGFWTGKRQYRVLLRPSPGGVDGFAHPPAFFSIGADRGYCFYSRQPPFCRRCRQSGHRDQECGTFRCRRCQGQGHEARDCQAPKRCYNCGEDDHLATECRKHRSYAAAAGGSAGPAAEPRMTEDDGRRRVSSPTGGSFVGEQSKVREGGSERGGDVTVSAKGAEEVTGLEQSPKKRNRKKRRGGSDSKEGEGGEKTEEEDSGGEGLKKKNKGVEPEEEDQAMESQGEDTDPLHPKEREGQQERRGRESTRRASCSSTGGDLTSEGSKGALYVTSPSPPGRSAYDEPHRPPDKQNAEAYL